MSMSSATSSSLSVGSLKFAQTLTSSPCESRISSPPTSYPGSPRSELGEFVVVKHKDSSPVIESERSRTVVGSICFVGAGFVGGPTAALVAYHNPQITVNVVDLDKTRIASWNSAHLPIHEPGLSKIVRIARDGTQSSTIDLPAVGTVSIPARASNLVFSTRVSESIAEADIVFICVNTPTKLYGIGAGAMADLSILESATAVVAKNAKTGAIIVEKSTVPCGTANIIRSILEFHRPQESFEVLSNPEFLAEGCAVSNLMYPDRILIGGAKTPSGVKAAEVLRTVYTAWVAPSKVLTVNTWSSELTKLIANAMLAQRISSINAVSALCEELGADVQEVARGLGADTRLGPRFLHAGVGFGGSCFEKDILNLSYMAQSLHLNEVANYWMEVLAMNKYQRQRFSGNVVRALNGSLKGKKVAILGFAFKEDTNDARNSVAAHVIADLAAEMPAEISVFDPGCAVSDIEREIRKVGISDAQMQHIKVRDQWREAVDDASAVCILTPWKHFKFASNVADRPYTPATPERKYLRISKDIGWLFNDRLSETNILELEKLVTTSNDDVADDPLNRFISETDCPSDCGECRAKQVLQKQGENVDWEDVAMRMREPRWVFDGRNCVDARQLEQLGFRVRGIGKS